MSNHRPAPVVDLAAVRAAEARLDRLLADHPELRDRTAAMLAGDLPCPDLEEPMAVTRNPQSPVNIRLPQSLLDRADALVPVAGQAPELATQTTITRADVLRLAVLRGLAALEAELAPSKA